VGLETPFFSHRPISATETDSTMPCSTAIRARSG
jgi:hypothetical protein